MKARYASAGADCVALGWAQGRVPSFADFSRLIKELNGSEASVIMSWMYHGCTASLLARGFLRRRVPYLWAIRAGVSPNDGIGLRGMRFVLGLCSRFIGRVFFVSERSRVQHERCHFKRSRSIFIPNGYDLEYFDRANFKTCLRAELGIEHARPVVAWAGRWHPDKGPSIALSAFSKAQREMPHLHLIMAGTGCEADGEAASSVANMGIKNVHLIGRQDDIRHVLMASNVFMLSSQSEAFPNVLAESMACGVPCVSTDVGDAAEIIGDTGIIVPVEDEVGLARGLTAILEEDGVARASRSLRARRRIAERYSMQKIAKLYSAIWRVESDGFRGNG
jgi:glycosyltransferase involved in cell wall biosynthesis